MFGEGTSVRLWVYTSFGNENFTLPIDTKVHQEEMSFGSGFSRTVGGKGIYHDFYCKHLFLILLTAEN